VSQVKKLLKRARKADTNAASQLLTVYYEDIYSYLRRLCGSQTDAEDLTQQTFLKVWSSLDRFKGRSRFSTWLYRIAYNCYIDWRRKNPGNVQSNTDQWWHECTDNNPGPVEGFARHQLSRQLYEAVDRLDEDKKQTVHLHYYQGLSLRETAKVLGVATSTVKYRLREVLRILRIRIDAEANEFDLRQTIPVAKGEPI